MNATIAAIWPFIVFDEISVSSFIDILGTVMMTALKVFCGNPKVRTVLGSLFGFFSLNSESTIDCE